MTAEQMKERIAELEAKVAELRRLNSELIKVNSEYRGRLDAINDYIQSYLSSVKT